MNIFFPETYAFFALLWLTGVDINVNSFWLLAQILCNYAKCKKMTNSKTKDLKKLFSDHEFNHWQKKDVNQSPLL